MWVFIRTQFMHPTRGAFDVEYRQEGERRICIARIGSKRFEEATDGDLWGLTFQKVVHMALDSPPFEASPHSKLEKRTHPPVTPPRRRAIRSVSNPPPGT